MSLESEAGRDKGGGDSVSSGGVTSWPAKLRWDIISVGISGYWNLGLCSHGRCGGCENIWRAQRTVPFNESFKKERKAY